MWSLIAVSQYDIQLSGYNALLRIVGEIHSNLYAGRNAALGLNKVRAVGHTTRSISYKPCSSAQDLEFHNIIPEYDAQLTQYYEDWYQRIEEAKPAQEGMWSFILEPMGYLSHPYVTDPVYSMRSALLPL
jgi:hypothetical protein